MSDLVVVSLKINCFNYSLKLDFVSCPNDQAATAQSTSTTTILKVRRYSKPLAIILLSSNYLFEIAGIRNMLED